MSHISIAIDNRAIESNELLVAIAQYNDAVASLARLRGIRIDRFGYGTEDYRSRDKSVFKAKERVLRLSFRDYVQANPHRNQNPTKLGGAA